MKKAKAPRFAHTANTQKGLGDFYGTGIKAKLGKVVEGMGMKPLSPKRLGKPPKNLA